MDVMAAFSSATKGWFEAVFTQPTPAQAAAWRSIASGEHTLVVAPTGSGKTLAAFLQGIDRVMSTAPDAPAGTRILYISPLKALAVDVERNLTAPLVGITRKAQALQETVRDVSVGVRTGDTPPSERRRLIAHPPDILITTPESLFLMLTSAARETLRTVHTVIIDEIHAVAGTKRGAHLALSLERLVELLPSPPQRIGLSATVQPHEEVARFLGGIAPVRIVAPRSAKKWDLSVVVPVDDLTNLPPVSDDVGSAARSLDNQPAAQGSVWPFVEQDILDRILEKRSTIVFVNSRNLAEKLTARLNELYADKYPPLENVETAPFEPPRQDLSRRSSALPPAQIIGGSGQTFGAEPLIAKAHHGSVSKEQRALIEHDLKAGSLRCVVATSSLELGIDMGAVDLVIQVGAPPSVASGLQRVGRAGHQVGETSYGLVYPKNRQDVLDSTVIARLMRSGAIEPLSVPRNPLDVLCQQTVAAVSGGALDIEKWFQIVRRSAPFASLPHSAFVSVVDLLSGRYPSHEFAELRPRIVWDRDTGLLTARPGAQRVAVTNAGTIPDRGMFAVVIASGDEEDSARGGRKVGELEEEMVYESRVGDVFALGATSWRIQEITHDRVIVLPAFGEPGRLPFWKGEGPGRPVETGREIGSFIRSLPSLQRLTVAELAHRAELDENAARNLLSLLTEQKESTGYLPHDRLFIVERVRDELGDWRVLLHSPLGRRVHEPWALVVAETVHSRWGVNGGVVASDDGIMVRIPDAGDEPPGAEIFLLDSAGLQEKVRDLVGSSALFASRFRECAARALLLPKSNPGKRAPLWQQRQRASQLLDVARKYPEFPLLLETARECLQDVYDLPALLVTAEQIAARKIRVVEVETDTPSPFARSLLFGYVAAFMYEGDTPLAERKAAALSLDPTLLTELLGQSELRDFLDPAVVAEVSQDVQWLTSHRQARSAEAVYDMLRLCGALSAEEVTERSDASADTVTSWLTDLCEARRIAQVTIAGQSRWATLHDIPVLRDALGIPQPVGVPVSLDSTADPLGDVFGQFTTSHGPFRTVDIADRLGVGTAFAQEILQRLAADNRLVAGEFTPDRVGTEWVDPTVLRRIRNRSLLAARQRIEPVTADVFARFLPSWQGVGGDLRGVDGVLSVVEQLAGVPLPASAWESLVLPARVTDYSPELLDALTTSGDIVFTGSGALTGNDGWISLFPGDLTAALPRTFDTSVVSDSGALETHLWQMLSAGNGGGFFFSHMAQELEVSDPSELVTALWNLVWAGLVSNDSFAPVRSYVGAQGAHRSRVVAQTRARSGRGVRSRRMVSSRPLRASIGGLPTVSGRWSAAPSPTSMFSGVQKNLPGSQLSDLSLATETSHAVLLAEVLLERYGVLTRGSVQAEGVTGGFSGVYRVLREMEQAGQCQRGYFIEKLGAAQFSSSGAIDQLREASGTAVVTLAATDPANPFGAALAWPELPTQLWGKATAEVSGASHRPGRKAGGIVTIIDGKLVSYLERGGRTLLVFTDDESTVMRACESLSATIRRAPLGRVLIETVNGTTVIGHPVADLLHSAGFSPTPKGMRSEAMPYA